MIRRVLLMCLVFALALAAYAQQDTDFDIYIVEDAPLLTLIHDGVVTAAAFNADGSQIISAGEDGFLRLWEAETGVMMWENDFGEPVRDALYSPDYGKVLAWTDMGTVVYADAETGALSEPLPNDGAMNVNSAQWRDDGTAVLLAVDNRVIAPVLRDPGWSASVIDVGYDDEVVDAEFALDETHLHTFTADGTTHIYDIESGEAITTLGFGDNALGAEWNTEETLALVWGNGGFGVLVDPDSPVPVHTLQHRTFLNGGRWNDAEDRIMTWAADDRVKIWDAESGDLLLELLHNDWVNGAVWNGDESRVLSWAYRTAWVWDGVTGQLLARLPHDNAVNGAAWNADETQIITWGWDGAVKLWDVAVVGG